MRTLTRYFVPAAILMVVGLVIWTTGPPRAALDRRAQAAADARCSTVRPPNTTRSSRICAICGRCRRSARSTAGSANSARPPATGAAATASSRRRPTPPAASSNATRACCWSPPTPPTATRAPARTIPSAVQRLEGVLGQYSEVLRRGPWQFDAAYNYEFLARRRDALIRARGQKPGQRGRQAARAAAAAAHPARPPGRGAARRRHERIQGHRAAAERRTARAA